MPLQLTIPFPIPGYSGTKHNNPELLATVNDTDDCVDTPFSNVRKGTCLHFADALDNVRLGIRQLLPDADHC